MPLCKYKCHDLNLIITTRCYAQFLLNCKWACPPTHHHWTSTNQIKETSAKFEIHNEDGDRL
jgi:hypothetical protein